MPRLSQHERSALRFLAGHLVLGILAGGLLFVLLVAGDMFSLRTLLLDDRNGWLAGLLLLFGLSVTFGSLALSAAIMSLGRSTDR